MNRRFETKGLDTGQVKEINGAWNYAALIGLPLTALISFRPFDPDGQLSSEDHCELYRSFRNKLGIYARQKEGSRQRRFDLAYVWTRECNPDGTGEHLHVLMHVPQRYFVHFEETVIGWHPNAGEIDVTPAHQKKVVSDGHKMYSAVGYILKQMTPQAWFMRGLNRKKGGSIVGKRGGVTRNLNLHAQTTPPSKRINFRRLESDLGPSYRIGS